LICCIAAENSKECLEYFLGQVRDDSGKLPFDSDQQYQIILTYTKALESRDFDTKEEYEFLKELPNILSNTPLATEQEIIVGPKFYQAMSDWLKLKWVNKAFKETYEDLYTATPTTENTSPDKDNKNLHTETGTDKTDKEAGSSSSPGTSPIKTLLPKLVEKIKEELEQSR
jgi:hypothetical protein